MRENIIEKLYNEFFFGIKSILNIWLKTLHLGKFYLDIYYFLCNQVHYLTANRNFWVKQVHYNNPFLIFPLPILKGEVLFYIWCFWCFWNSNMYTNELYKFL